MIRVVVMALAMMVMLASSASAECAWVLWQGLLGPHAIWTRLDVFDTRAACVTFLDKEQRDNSANAQRRSETHLSLYNRAEEVCLPETMQPNAVDPFGPKGKRSL